jgi:capsular polysaccharide biosynthesis protein
MTSNPATPQVELKDRYPTEWLHAAFFGARPTFYSLRAAKAAAVGGLGLDAAASWLMRSAGFLGSWRATVKPLESLISYARRKGAISALIRDSRDVVVPAVHRIGAPPVPPEHHRTRTFFVAQLADAVVYSKSNTIATGEAAVLDFQGRELELFDLDLNVDGAVLIGDAREFALLEQSDTQPVVIERALTLVGLHSFNFGHWVNEFLPKLWACLDLPGFNKCTLLVDAQMPEQHFQSLKLFAPQNAIRVVAPGERVEVRRLWTVSAPVNFPIGRKPGAASVPGLVAVDPDVFGELIDKVSRRYLQAILPSQDRLVYLARGDNQHRRMLNSSTVMPWFEARGFRSYDFYRVDFESQLQLMRGADVVIGPDGSAFFSTFFARPGTSLGILNDSEVVNFELAALVWEALAMPLCVLEGEAMELPPGQYFNDYRVREHMLPAFLDQVMGSSRPSP